MKKISFLIIAHNRLEQTICCLESLLKFEGGEEILVLDNGSEEPVYSKVIETFSCLGVKTFKSERNLGVVGGRNLLLGKANGDILVLVDNDVELTCAIGKKIRENLRDVSIGVYGQRGIMFSDELLPFVVPDGEVDAIAGFFQCFRADLLDEIGMLDGNFKIYGQEDFDFCLRAKKAGYKIIADSSLPVVHHGDRFMPQAVENESTKQENFKYFYNKWKDSLDILEIERKKINRLSCLNCSQIWEREIGK